MAAAGATPTENTPDRAASTELRRIASFPPSLTTNPYQALLYHELSKHGFELAPPARFRLPWLFAQRGKVHILHFHWPHPNWRHRHGPVPIRVALSWIKLALFRLRLAVARGLGYRTVWTVHQVYPHETRSRIHDRRGARTLARACDLLLVHDAPTLELARREFGRAVRRIGVAPHGSYTGFYPPGRGRSAVREELGIAPEELVFLVFGKLRAYKQYDRLLEAFFAASIPGARLLIAGEGTEAVSVARAIRDDARVLLLAGYIPDDRVAELFGASDVAVMPRSDGGTSGSLILALSLGLPTIAARTHGYQELVGDELAGWLFDPHEGNGLRDTLRRAAATSAEDRRARGRAALQRAAGLPWSESGRCIADWLRSMERESAA